MTTNETVICDKSKPTYLIDGWRRDDLLLKKEEKIKKLSKICFGGDYYELYPDIVVPGSEPSGVKPPFSTDDIPVETKFSSEDSENTSSPRQSSTIETIDKYILLSLLPKDRQEFRTDARIVLDYTKNSHVLLGDFKEKFKFFRIHILSPAEWAHFHGRLLTGAGWVIQKDSITKLIVELNLAEITFDKVTFDQKYREDYKRKYRQKRKRKTLFSNLSRKSVGKLIQGKCPRILYKRTVRACRCNKPLFRNGICHYHWKKSQLQVVR